MFSVGLFSTYLPYVVLAMFYGAYVGVHSIMKIEQSAEDDSSPKKEEVIRKTFGTEKSGNNQRTYYYDNFAEKSETAAIRPISMPVFRKIHVPPGAVPRSSTYLPLYSRPPPVA